MDGIRTKLGFVIQKTRVLGEYPVVNSEKHIFFTMISIVDSSDSTADGTQTRSASVGTKVYTAARFILHQLEECKNLVASNDKRSLN